MSSFDPLIRNILNLDEGRHYEPYLDSKGYWTIGVGYLIGKDLQDLKLSWNVVEAMLKETIEIAVEDCEQVLGDDFKQANEARQLALVSMMFNLGRERFSGFRRMIAAIKAGDWGKAAFEATNSKWARDVDPKQREGLGRDDRLAYMLKTGEVHSYYKLPR
jgi:lysozyme